MSDAAAIQRHRFYEDVLALLLGTLVVALGANLYAETVLLTGGTMGLALLLQHLTGLHFGAVFFVVNLPFYLLGLRRMGWQLTLRTFAAVLLVSVFSRLTPLWIGYAHLSPAYASIAGGGLMGIGMLMLFRHRASLGGVNLLALYLQDRYGLRAGYVQLAVDAAILLAACFTLDAGEIGLSLLGAAVLNLIIAMNHRPGRYLGVS